MVRRRSSSALSIAATGLAGMALLLLAVACTSSGPTGGRTTQDARVKSFVGQVPPDVLTQGQWVSRAGPTSLASLRGRVVYLQFAFPQ